MECDFSHDGFECGVSVEDWPLRRDSGLDRGCGSIANREDGTEDNRLKVILVWHRPKLRRLINESMHVLMD